MTTLPRYRKVNKLKHVVVHEVSLVDSPACPGADILLTKKRDQPTSEPAADPAVMAFSLLKALGAAMAPSAASAQQFVLAGRAFPKIYDKARRALGAVPDLDAASQESIAALLTEAKTIQAGDPSLSLEQALMAAYDAASNDTDNAVAKAFDPAQARDDHGRWTGSVVGAAAALAVPAVVGRYTGGAVGGAVGRAVGRLSGLGHAAENVITQPLRFANWGRRGAAAIRAGKIAGSVAGKLVGGRVGLVLGLVDGALQLNSYLAEHNKSATPAPAVTVAKGLPMKDGLVWGWASVADLVDHQNDVIDETEMQKMAHRFLTGSRTAGVMHAKGPDGQPVQVGEVCESVVLTKELQRTLGIDLKKSGWLVGMRITDPKVKQMVADGVLKSFSIGGKGRREEITDTMA